MFFHPDRLHMEDKEESIKYKTESTNDIIKNQHDGR